VAAVAAFSPPWLKIPSALITNRALLAAYRNTGLPLLVSTGMSTWEEIDDAMEVLTDVGPERTRELTLMMCTSTYPAPLAEMNLSCIPVMAERYGLPVGFSSHAVSPWPAVYATCFGATVIEAHLTLSRASWGSDQAASLEPAAFKKMVQEIRDIEIMRGDGQKVCYASEEPIKAKLRR
jgi:N-acetylneuraminate synthase